MENRMSRPSDEDLDEIEPNLYLGNFETACNSEVLQNYQIKRVLSVLQRQIDESFKVEGIAYKYINLWDTQREDIISYFPECFDFIFKGQYKSENVYVHCKAGVSRSATVVIAFLMKKYGYSAESTIEIVSSIRNIVCPNSGFLFQLRLWEKMSYKLDGSDPEYRLIMFQGLKNKIGVIEHYSGIESYEICCQSFSAAFDSYIIKLKIAERNSLGLINRGITYRCKKCLCELFYEINIIQNTDSLIECDFIYIEPQNWILKQIVMNAEKIEGFIIGSIECLKCNEILGLFDWNTSALNNNVCDCEAHKGLDYFLVIKIIADLLIHK